MELLNTLIIDANTPEKRSEFMSLVNDNPFIVFVVLGDDAAARAIVEAADLIADDHQGRIARRVAWIKGRDFFKADCLAFLKTHKEDFDEAHYNNVLAFTLSPVWHETKFIFRKGDPAENLDVSHAYWMASLRERAAAPNQPTT